MGLDARQKRILECGMELMRIKEALSDLADGSPFVQANPRALELRKRSILSEVEQISARDEPNLEGGRYG